MGSLPPPPLRRPIDILSVTGISHRLLNIADSAKTTKPPLFLHRCRNAMACYADPIKTPENLPPGTYSSHAGKRDVVGCPGFQSSSADPTPSAAADEGLPGASPRVPCASSSVLNTILSSKKVMYCCGQSALRAEESMKLSSVPVEPSVSTTLLFRSEWSHVVSDNYRADEPTKTKQSPSGIVGSHQKISTSFGSQQT